MVGGLGRINELSFEYVEFEEFLKYKCWWLEVVRYFSLKFRIKVRVKEKRFENYYYVSSRWNLELYMIV